MDNLDLRDNHPEYHNPINSFNSQKIEKDIQSKKPSDKNPHTTTEISRIISSFNSIDQAFKKEFSFIKHIFLHQKFPTESNSLIHHLLRTNIFKQMANSFANNYKNYPIQLRNAYETANSNIRRNFQKILIAREINNSSHLEPKIFSATGDETNTRGELQGRGKYQTIEHKFIAKDGTELGNETIARIDTITQRKASLKAKIKFLEDKLSNGDITNITELHHIDRQLTEARIQLNVCNNKKNDWMGSNDSREILKGNGIEIDRTNNISVAVNQRTQNITAILPFGNEEKTLSMQRFGAIWDPRNGLLNLKELQSYAKDFKEGISSELLNTKIDARIGEFKALRMKYNTNDQLFIIDESIRTLESFRPGTGSLEKQKEIIDNRKNFLREQTLEPIKQQLLNNSHRITSDEDGNGIFRMMHLGLLNQNASDDIQESGWVHIESNQILDMQAAFESIDNLVIKVREEKGTFFDEDTEGNAVLYVSANDIGWQRELPAELTLETCFMNICVQGHTINDGIQAEINKKSMTKLGSWLPKNQEIITKYNELRNRLEKENESSFELAADIALLANNVSAMSEGCLSCKDRGGTVAEIIAIKFIENSLNDYQKGRAINHTKALKYISNAMQKFSNEIFNMESPAVKIVNDCTGVSVVKVDFRELSRMGVINRVYELGRIAFAALTGGLKVAEEES